MASIHDELRTMFTKSFEYIHQYIDLLMILVHIQQEPDLCVVLHNGSIAFIGLNYQPLSFPHFGVADLPFLDDTGKSRTTDNAGLKTRFLQDIKDHGTGGALAGSASHRDGSLGCTDHGQQFTSPDDGDVQCF